MNKINIIAGRIKYMWGLDSTEQISTEINNFPFQIFRETNVGTSRLGPINSLYISFSLAQSVPDGTTFKITLTVGATGILEGSIVTNLPGIINVNSASTLPSRPRCYYASPDIICKDVGALNKKNYEYFIAFKGFYDSSISSINNYGQVVITSVVTDA